MSNAKLGAIWIPPMFRDLPSLKISVYISVVDLQKILPEMREFLETLKTQVVVGLVGGSDLPKITEQMTLNGGGDGMLEN